MTSHPSLPPTDVDDDVALSEEEKQKIRAEQIRMVYRSTVQTLPALAIVLGGLGYLIGLHVLDLTPYFWASLVFVFYVYRMWIANRALAADMTDAKLIAHSSIMTLLTSAMGVLAGGGLLYYFPELPGESQALVTMICVGWISGAVGVSGLYPRYIIPWFIAFGGSLVLSWALFGQSNRFLVAFMLAFLVVYLWITTDTIGKKTVESIRIRFKNVDLNARLQASLETKSRFIAAANHDLRQPLMLIKIICANVIDARDKSSAIEHAKKLVRPVHTLETMLDSLVMNDRLEKPLQPAPNEFDLNALRDEIVEAFEVRAENAHLGFLVSADSVVVNADRHLVSRCVGNLLDNAFKFTAIGSIAVELRCPDRVTLEITVADTGHGIAAQDLPRVFDAYYQASDVARAGTDGVGLGLAIVQRLVVLMNGEVGVESEVGLGTRFCIRLPVHNHPPAAAHRPAAPQESALLRESRSIRLEVLFVEDNLQQQDEWSSWCERHGHRGLFASTGEEARNLSNGIKSVPDAIVADYRLPDCTGLEVIAELKHKWSAVPAILLTGEVDPSIAVAARAANIVVLHKPVEPSRVFNEILTMIEA